MSLLLQSSLKLSRTRLIPYTFKAVRTMTSNPTQKYEWLVVIPDQPGKLEKRMEVRPKHFEGIQAQRSSGFMKMGGALLDEVPKEGEPMKMNGSMAVVEAATREEVIENLKKDIYGRSEVWDFEKIQIYPFKCAFRDPL